MDTEQFESRKKDHLELALRDESEAKDGYKLHSIRLVHEALPDLDFSDVTLSTKALGLDLPTPFLLSSMTAGHPGARSINSVFAEVSAERGWLMGVGSQRRELTDAAAFEEWRDLRGRYPKVKLLGNIGLSQLIQTPVQQIERLVDGLQAVAMIVHLNPLQECIQPEGTPQFRGGLQAIASLAERLSVPVVVKETGCGISARTLARLAETKVRAVDVSGLGGTHWGRIEGMRAQGTQAQAAVTFADWGLPTVDSLLAGVDLQAPFELWASGGVRTGLDAAKLLAMGANIVGFARPILQAGLEGPEALAAAMERIEFETKTALFCTGCDTTEKLRSQKVWQWV